MKKWMTVMHWVKTVVIEINLRTIKCSYLQIDYPLYSSKLCYRLKCFSHNFVEYILKKMVGLSKLAKQNLFIRFLKKMKQKLREINNGTAVPALSDGFWTAEQFDRMILWGRYAPILFFQLKQLNIDVKHKS